MDTLEVLTLVLVIFAALTYKTINTTASNGKGYLLLRIEDSL